MVTPKQIGMLGPGSRNLDGADKGVLALKSVPALCIQFHRQVEFQSRPAVGISRRPRFSTIERTIAIPIPFDLVVKKVSKSRGMPSGSMPFPEPNRDVDAPAAQPHDVPSLSWSRCAFRR
jgi:hypothetical protein